MIKKSGLLFFILLIVIKFFTYPQCAFAQENSQLNSSSFNIESSKLTLQVMQNQIQRINEELINTKELNKKMLSMDTEKVFVERLIQIDEKYQKELDRFWRYVTYITTGATFLVAILTFCSWGGIKNVYDTWQKLSQTHNLFNIMEKQIIEKEKELHKDFDFVREKKKNNKYNLIADANYLDFEHKLYFAHLYLPINKDTEKYKKSLFILGKYWCYKEKYGRAVLRFEELQKIQEQLDCAKTYIFRLLMSIGRKKIFEERILGENTSNFFNAYGIAYDGCAQEKDITLDEKEEFTEKAKMYYKKAIQIDPNYSAPYYNLGRLYSLTEGNNELGITWYNKTFGKYPDLSLFTYRNIACCQIRLKKTEKEILHTLKNIPLGHPYWLVINKDDVINNKKYLKNMPLLQDFLRKRQEETTTKP